MKNKAFTLIEVLIATMILSVTLIALSGGEGVAIRATRRAMLFTQANILASNLMAEIDLMIEVKGFKYLEKIGKKKEGSFDDKAYEKWKWLKEVKEVEMPISELMKSLISGGEEDKNELAAEEEVFIGLISANIDKVMKQSLREITVTVFWPVRAGKDYSSISLVYYVVDYEEVNKYVPSL